MGTLAHVTRKIYNTYLVYIKTTKFLKVPTFANIFSVWYPTEII